MERTYLIRKSRTAFFADDPIATTNAAWDKAVHQKISPAVGPNGNLVYDIPYSEAGLQGGGDSRAAGNPILDSVRIVTATAVQNLAIAFEHYNEKHPHR
ncbi:hypothetical protein [Burkholderia ubonensis]|uniref:hypothetical protein n=1 Tax=Burkholderia ubonensis TaxID=101571 RepID=UPI0018DF5A4D|nr:hypothetical protein [Burkholderia ubonensis]